MFDNAKVQPFRHTRVILEMDYVGKSYDKHNL